METHVTRCSIYARTQQCYESFDAYLSSQNASQAVLAQCLLERLRVWDKYANARAREGYRLDDRLADSPQILDVLCALLAVVSESIHEGTSAPPERVARWHTDIALVKRDLQLLNKRSL